MQESEFSDIENLVLKSGDGFKKKDSFSIFVSNLPYSKSKDAIEWFAQPYIFSWSDHGSKRICTKTCCKIKR